MTCHSKYSHSNIDPPCAFLYPSIYLSIYLGARGLLDLVGVGGRVRVRVRVGVMVRVGVRVRVRVSAVRVRVRAPVGFLTCRARTRLTGTTPLGAALQKEVVSSEQ